MWLPSYHTKTNLIPEMEFFFLGGGQDFEAILQVYVQDLITIVGDLRHRGRHCNQIQYLRVDLAQTCNCREHRTRFANHSACLNKGIANSLPEVRLKTGEQSMNWFCIHYWPVTNPLLQGSLTFQTLAVLYSLPPWTHQNSAFCPQSASVCSYGSYSKQRLFL
jgi:hypothetical protein